MRHKSRCRRSSASRRNDRRLAEPCLAIRKGQGGPLPQARSRQRHRRRSKSLGVAWRLPAAALQARSLALRQVAERVSAASSSVKSCAGCEPRSSVRQGQGSGKFSCPTASPSMTDFVSFEAPATLFEIGQGSAGSRPLQLDHEIGSDPGFAYVQVRTCKEDVSWALSSTSGTQGPSISPDFGQFQPLARRFGRQRREAKHYISVPGYGSKGPGRRSSSG